MDDVTYDLWCHPAWSAGDFCDMSHTFLGGESRSVRLRKVSPCLAVSYCPYNLRTPAAFILLVSIAAILVNQTLKRIQ